jgi:hypothetical protein
VKLLGRLGWHGQCACCCGNDDKRAVKRQEDRAWRREFEVVGLPRQQNLKPAPDKS